MLTLYLCPGTSSMAPHIALHEVGAKFDVKHISLAKKDNRTPEYLAVNPEGKVPTLLIDGRRLTEVAGILYYVARRYPEAGLFPAGDIEAEAQVISWLSFNASAVHPARGRGNDHLLAMWQLADQRLGKSEWAVGGKHSIADIHLFRLFWRISAAMKWPRGSYPNVEAHYDRMMARPAVKRTIAVETAMGYDPA